MIKTIEEVVAKMNIRGYTIYINKLMSNFNKYKSQRELLIELFREAYQIEFQEMDNYSELKKSIGLGFDGYGELRNIVAQLKNRLTIKGLAKCHEATGEQLYVIAQLYITVLKKYESYANLYKQFELNSHFEDEITIKRRLKFTTIISNKDKKKIITLEKPTFNALGIEEIKEILGFSQHIQFKRDEELIGFLNNNERVFSKEFSSNYLVKGNVIYFNIYETEIGLNDYKGEKK